MIIIIMALPFWWSLSLMTLPSEVLALPLEEKHILPNGKQ